MGVHRIGEGIDGFPLLAPDGSVSDAPYSFASQPGRGVYLHSGGSIGLSHNIRVDGDITFPNSSAASPTFKTNYGSANTGIWTTTANNVVGLTNNGTATIETQNASGTLKIGFFNTAAVAQPTGVAVTAPGIHAALVSLGLITA